MMTHPHALLHLEIKVWKAGSLAISLKPRFLKRSGDFIENPIYDMSIEGSVHIETLGNHDIEEEHSEFAYDHLERYHSKSYRSISNEDLEKQCSEESDMM